MPVEGSGSGGERELPKSAMRRRSRPSPIGHQNVRFQRTDVDEIYDTHVTHTSDVSQPVKIFTRRKTLRKECEKDDDDDGDDFFHYPPITLMTALRRRATASPKRTALVQRLADDKWKKISFKEYYELVRTAAKAFIQFGLKKHHGVGIMNYNSSEWFIANLAAIFAGGVSVVLSSKHGPDVWQRIATEAMCDIILVKSEHQCAKVFDIKDSLPDLKVIVQMRQGDSKPQDTEQAVIVWNDLIRVGEEKDDKDLLVRMLEQAPNSCCALIYQFAPGGNVRAVMLSHDNLLWTALSVGNHFNLRNEAEKIVSYLPLSTAKVQVFDVYMPIVFGISVYFSKPHTIKLLREVRPSIFLGVPSVYNEMADVIGSYVESQTRLQRRITEWAAQMGRQMHRARSKGFHGRPFGYCLANLLVYGRLRRMVGLSRSTVCISGEPSVSPTTQNLFVGSDVDILEMYGLNESAGFQVMSSPDRFRVKSVGRELDRCYLVIDSLRTDGQGYGEICLKGRNVFMGYLGASDELLDEVFDAEGWFHTGDTGARTDDGYVYVTGRIDDEILMPNGERIRTTKIEEIVKKSSQWLSNCILIGEGREFLALLISLKTKEEYGVSSNQLSEETVTWLENLGCSNLATVNDVLDKTDDRIVDAIQKTIDSVNDRATLECERIKKWAILSTDFSHQNRDIDENGAIDRREIAEKYSTLIDSLYSPLE